ncbi:site-specific integrase [Nonomuraea turcica]|uniref:site-specific integrase n=1 Tax=Nonomuraea sp. G32 TaxID=3067274 RepID=UPI0035301ECC
MDDFLTDLANAGASAHTRRAYRGDLIAFAAHHGEEIGALSAVPVRAFLAELAELSPASRKRKRAAVAPSPSGRSGTTSWPPTRWTASTRSRCPRACRARPRPPTSSRC